MTVATFTDVMMISLNVATIDNDFNEAPAKWLGIRVLSGYRVPTERSQDISQPPPIDLRTELRCVPLSRAVVTQAIGVGHTLTDQEQRHSTGFVAMIDQELRQIPGMILARSMACGYIEAAGTIPFIIPKQPTTLPM